MTWDRLPNKMKLWLDFETHSTIPIRRGTDAYLEGATPLIMTWAIDDGPIQIHNFLSRGCDVQRLEALVNSADEIWAHNAFFDRNVLRKLFGIKTDIYKWRCSMAQALVHGLPGGLDPLCVVLDLPSDLAKMKDGKRLIQKFCCGKTILPWSDPEWRTFEDYAVNDISAMRECVKRMPNWNYVGEELRLWHIDQIINDRGFAVDIPLANEAVKALKTEKEKLDDAIWVQTCGSVTAATQRDKLLMHLAEAQGCFLPDLTAKTIRAALEDETLDEATKAILRIRLAAASTSGSKFKRMLEVVSKDGRMRGTMQYAGANRTARWAGRGFQPHNLPRPNMKLGDIRNVIECLRTGNSEAISLFAPLGQACMNVLRGLIIAGGNDSLGVSDYSAIEGRANAWLAGENWKVKAFRDGMDMYCRIYEQAFNLPAGTVGEKDPRRQIGKVMELALGYGGGVGAFINMATVYNLDLDEIGRQVVPEEKSLEAWDRAVIAGETFGLSKATYCACDTLKLRYRRANPAINAFWYQLEDAARAVIAEKDPALKIHVGMLTFDCDKFHMRIKLPSGRYLCYALPKIGGRKLRSRELDESDFNSKGEISYMSWRNKKWVRTKTYGGKLCENIVQAVSRDLLGFALLGMHDAGFQVVLHVHDEVLVQLLLDSGLTFEGFNHIMHTRPKWAVGFPMKAEGYQSPRYEKR